MEGICLQALISGVISKNDIRLISDNNQIIYINEKPIIVNDKFTLISCSDKIRFDKKLTKDFKLNTISEIESKK